MSSRIPIVHSKCKFRLNTSNLDFSCWLFTNNLKIFLPLLKRSSTQKGSFICLLPPFHCHICHLCFWQYLSPLLGYLTVARSFPLPSFHRRWAIEKAQHALCMCSREPAVKLPVFLTGNGGGSTRKPIEKLPGGNSEEYGTCILKLACPSHSMLPVRGDGELTFNHQWGYRTIFATRRVILSNVIFIFYGSWPYCQWNSNVLLNQ